MRFLLALTLALLLATPVRAQDQPGTITTHATARTRLPNTVADVAIGIDAHGQTLSAVQQALADGSKTLLGYLREAGAERLVTEQVAVSPDTEAVRGAPNRIVGYSGRVRVRFRVAADKLDQTLGNALARGGNTLESTSLVPRQAEVDAARQELAAQAVRTALAQAKAVAEAAGRRLGPVRQIQVDPGFGLPRPLPAFATAKMMDVAAPIATEAGDSEVAATVSVTVGLVEP